MKCAKTINNIGYSKVNRVSVAPDETGHLMLCYQGNKKQLSLISGLFGAVKWKKWNCIAYPLNRTNILVTETIGAVDETTDDYIIERSKFLAAPKGYADLYPETPLNEPPPLQHQIEAFAFALQGFSEGQMGFGQWSAMGCVEGDALIPINRATREFTITLRDLYLRFNRCALVGNRVKNPSWDQTIPTYARALCDGYFHQHRIQSVLFKGNKKILRITTKSGKMLRLTPDHEVATPGIVWVQAQKLNIGDLILTNGQKICRQCGISDQMERRQARKSKHLDICKKCAYSIGSKNPNKRKLRGPNHPNWKGGRLIDSDGYVRISGLYGHHREQGCSGQVYEHILVAEEILGRKVLKSEHVHHKDENKSNNCPSNLEVITPGEHHKKHNKFLNMNGGICGKGGEICFIPKEDEIISIEDAGETDVYDIVMDDPHRNFVANGIVVHNCGKTRWSCDLSRFIVSNASIIVCQNSTSFQWKNWMERICPDFNLQMLVGMPLKQRSKIIHETLTQKQPEEKVVFLVNWDALARLLPDLIKIKPDLVIADECHRAKNKQSQMAKALHKLGNAATYRVAMTGTPIGNTPFDLWSIYRFIDPTIFGRKYWEFVKLYFILGGWAGNEFVGFKPHMIGRFIDKMYGSAYRITKASITDMPEKNYEVVKLEMAGDQKSVYNQISEGLYASLQMEDGKTKSLSVQSTLAAITRLQQVTAGLFPTDSGDCERLNSAKTEWLKAYCEDVLSENDLKIVVWCRFTDEIKSVCSALESISLHRGIDYEYIDGSIKIKNRGKILDSFNESDSHLRILICQIQAGAYGLDIPRADCMIFHTSGFSYLERSQAEDRGHRIGRVRPYQIIDLCCVGTVDKKILDTLKKKKSLSDMLLVSGFLD